MENIEVDAKLVIIVIFISILIGTLLWAGYNIYIEATQDENKGIEKFEGDMTSNIATNDDSTISNNNEFDISGVIGEEEFEINNSNAEAPKQGWLKRKTIFRQARI